MTTDLTTLAHAVLEASTSPGGDIGEWKCPCGAVWPASRFGKGEVDCPVCDSSGWSLANSLAEPKPLRVETPNRELALASAVLSLQAIAEETAPRCLRCESVATKSFKMGRPYYCDEHAIDHPNTIDLPHADAVRKLRAAVAKVEGET